MSAFPPARPAAKSKSAPEKKEREPKAKGHAFEVDESLPPDFFGLYTCAHCHAVGRDGDARHPFGSPPAPPKWPPAPEEDRSRQILGEGTA